MVSEIFSTLGQPIKMIICILVFLLYTYFVVRGLTTGKVFIRKDRAGKSGSPINKSKDPKEFWAMIIIYIIMLLVLLFFSKEIFT